MPRWPPPPGCGWQRCFCCKAKSRKSIHWFQQARQLGSADAEFFNNVGVALAKRGAAAQAGEMFARAAQAGPKFVAPAANQAHLFAAQGAEPDPAGEPAILAELQRALKLAPKNPTLYNCLGLVFCREQRYDEAVPQFRQALMLAGDDPALKADAHNNLGLALTLCGDDGAAEFEAALQSDPAHAPALANLALARMKAAGGAPEVEKLARAAHIDPASAAVRADYGYGLCRLGAINDGILGPARVGGPGLASVGSLREPRQSLRRRRGDGQRGSLCVPCRSVQPALPRSADHARRDQDPGST